MSETVKDNRKKQSIIAGALTGSAGVFITKAIGLLYVIPFKKLAGNNTVFYSYAYTIYDYVLQICLSGMPFAIAALVSKYVAKNDYKAVNMVRRISRTVMLIFGFIACSALILFSKPFAMLVIPDGVSEDYIVKTQTVLVIVSFAMIAVPLLSYFRGVYQGFKDLRIYAFTQVLEQLIRVTFLLGASAICVYVLHMDKIWAAYMGVASTSISAVATIIYFLFYEAKHRRKPAEEQQESEVTPKGIFKELMEYAVPYLISTLVTNSSGLFILLMLSTGLQKYGTDPYLITTYQGIINYEAHKICSIPQVIATGFSLALIPHITEAITRNDEGKVREMIQKVLETVNYLAVPVVFFMVFFAREIYFVMYGNANLDVGAYLLARSLIIQLLWIVVMVLSSILVALKLRKIYIALSLVQLVFVTTTLIFWLGHFGVNGYYICKAIEYVVFIIGACYFIEKHFKPSFRKIFDNCTLSWLALLPMLILAAVLTQVKFDITEQSRLVTLMYTGVMGILIFGMYFIVSAKFNVPQHLFNVEISRDSISDLLSGRIFKK
ncbi:MAG: oligosaccharide flippase family protein [Erysipelotrichaceae bacterium]|nr:oligosaccharide flippase family protein [Erysipelotrichaceae bacterium]